MTDSPTLYLRAASVLTPFEQIPDGAVLVGNGRVLAVGPAAAVLRPPESRLVDCGATTLVPGFVDLHLHGSGGATAMEGVAGIERVGAFVARHGVTAWLPTLTPLASIDDLADLVAGCARAVGSSGRGAEAVGLHLEGPFLNPRRPGAIRPEGFRPPAARDLARLLDAGAGRVRLMTLAPELPGGLDLVRGLVARGVVASVGHTDATLDEAEAAIAAGVSHATHTFNAMRGLHHRDPGVVGAVLASDAVRAELIADGIHVHPTAMQALIRAKGTARVVLITDAVAAAGQGDGVFEFDGRPITVRNGRATLADGTIAGSVATFDDNLRRIVRTCGVPLGEAVRMASTIPAWAVGLADRKGALVGGRDADVVALDADLRVRLTVARGEIVFDTLAR